MPAVSSSKWLTMAGWEHVPHLDEKTKKELLDSTPPYLRKARSEGIPTQGSGAVFPVAEAIFSYDKSRHEPFPQWFKHIAGIDFGWDHPTAVVWVAYEADTDTAYVYDCYRQREGTPVIHAAAMRPRGLWIPVAWPHDGLQHDKGSGIQIAEQYRQQGVNMLQEMATFEKVNTPGESQQSRVSVEAGLFDMLDRMQTGRLKVAAHLVEWWEEFRLYHRKNGAVVKKMDDLLSATRYALMMIRFATIGGRPVQSFEPGRAVNAAAFEHETSFEPS